MTWQLNENTFPKDASKLTLYKRSTPNDFKFTEISIGGGSCEDSKPCTITIPNSAFTGNDGGVGSYYIAVEFSDTVTINAEFKVTTDPIVTVSPNSYALPSGDGSLSVNIS